MTRKGRSFTAAQKAEAVRKHLKDHVPVSQIAEEIHAERDRKLEEARVRRRQQSQNESLALAS